MVSGSRSMLVVGRVDGRIRSSRQYGMATSAELMAFSNLVPLLSCIFCWREHNCRSSAVDAVYERSAGTGAEVVATARELFAGGDTPSGVSETSWT